MYVCINEFVRNVSTLYIRMIYSCFFSDISEAPVCSYGPWTYNVLLFYKTFWPSYLRMT